jgi:hypothetical protein
LLSALAVEHADDASLCGIKHRVHQLELGPATAARAVLYRLSAYEIRRAEMVCGQHDRTPLFGKIHQ